MAILPSRPGIEITVKCNGANLQEYEDDDDDPQPDVVTKYVEAVSGAEFGVQWEIIAPWPPHYLVRVLARSEGQRQVLQANVLPASCIHLP